MITDVPGITVGHWTDPEARTGCTVVLCPEGTVGSGEVRGGAPGTRETDLLRPGMLVEHVDAVLLSGGSAFGLAAADGVMKWLSEKGRGFETGFGRVPIVPAAVLFDLAEGSPDVRPGPMQGYSACEGAAEAFARGRVGAGTGATVAKLNGPEHAAPGGIGSVSERDGDLVVAALVAVNSVGDVVTEDGEVLVGPTGGSPREPGFGNTTLAVVATNAALSRERTHLLAVAAHDGFDAAIRPAHTLYDGDTVFTLATGPVEAPQRQVEAMAVRAVAAAIREGVRP